MVTRTVSRSFIGRIYVAETLAEAVGMIPVETPEGVVKVIGAQQNKHVPCQ